MQLFDVIAHSVIIALFYFFIFCFNTDLSGTRGGMVGGVLDPASEGRGGLGGGWILSDMS